VKIWTIEESNILDDYSFKLLPQQISNPSEILPCKHYIISREGAYYDNNVGLIFGEKGLANFELSEKKVIEDKEKEFFMRYDPWINHAKETLKILDTHFIPKYDFVIKKFSEAFDISKEGLIEKIRVVAALHDIGKLNIYWQEKIGWDGKTPLAHNDKVDVTRIGIPHATVSAKALSSSYNEWGEVAIPILLAIAHHHSPYSQEYKPYEFINNWKAVIEELSLPINLKNIIDKSKIGDRLEFGIPYLGYEKNIVPYRFYAFVSKILRLSDWIATGGEKQWNIM
jgi:CRISPR-associated endonuclease/helicase Cas3